MASDVNAVRSYDVSEVMPVVRLMSFCMGIQSKYTKNNFTFLPVMRFLFCSSSKTRRGIKSQSQPLTLVLRQKTISRYCLHLNIY